MYLYECIMSIKFKLGLLEKKLKTHQQDGMSSHSNNPIGHTGFFSTHSNNLIGHISLFFLTPRHKPIPQTMYICVYFLQINIMTFVCMY